MKPVTADAEHGWHGANGVGDVSLRFSSVVAMFVDGSSGVDVRRRDLAKAELGILTVDAIGWSTKS